MPQHDRPRLVRAAAKGVVHIEDRIAIAVIGPGNRVVMGDGDQTGPKIDEGEDRRLGEFGRDGQAALARATWRMRGDA